MDVTITYLGQLGHLLGQSEETVAVEEGAGLLALLRQVCSAHGPEFEGMVFTEQGELRPSLMVLVNDAPVDKALPGALNPGDSVTLLPAIAGG